MLAKCLILVCGMNLVFYLCGCSSGVRVNMEEEWSGAQKLCNTDEGYYADFDLLAARNGVYVLFRDIRAYLLGGEIVFKTFGHMMEKVSNISVEKDEAYIHLVECPDGLYIVGSKNGVLGYRKSEDRGKTWSAYEQLGVDMTTMGVKNISPVIVNGLLYIFGSAMDPSMHIIVDRSIKKMPEQPIHLSIFLLSENKDGTWKKSEIFSRDVSILGGFSPTMSRGCWYDGVLHVVWADKNPIPGAWESHEAVFYSRSEDKGITWSSPVVLAERIGGEIYDPLSITANETGVHLSWPDYRHRKMHWLDFRWPFPSDIREENYEIYYRRSLDNGKTWEKDIRISEGISHSFYPSMAVEGSHITIVWTGNRRPGRNYFYRIHPTDLWIRESFDGGNSWGPISKVEDCAKDGYSIHKPKIVLQNGKRHLLYIKGKHTPRKGSGLVLLREPPYEVLYRESIDK